MKLKTLHHLTGCLFLNDSGPAPGYLQGISPDVGSSAITENHISDNPQYDLTIIIPVYNTERFIGQCIQSIIRQKTDYRVCITVVNDGSTDRSREIIESYAGKADINLINQENGGFSAARNAGIRNIDSRYIAFVDSDDYLPEDERCLDTLLKTAYENDVDIVQGGWETFQDDRTLSTVNMRCCNNAERITGYPWGKIYKSRLWKNICYPEKYWYEDTVINMLIRPQCSRIVTIDRIVYRYRINPAGITHTSRGKAKSLDTLYVTKALMTDRLNLGIPVKERDLDEFFDQIRMNISRTMALRDPFLQKCMFEEHLKIYRTVFAPIKTKKARNKFMENALEQGSFRKYILAGIF